MEWHPFLLVPMDHRNKPVPSQATWENNLSPLNVMHIHQISNSPEGLQQSLDVIYIHTQEWKLKVNTKF